MTSQTSTPSLIEPERKKAASPRKTAMDCLARREHSRAELREKLISKQYAAEEADAAVELLAQQGLVSDERFAEAFTASRVRKGQGPVRVRLELEQRGVDSCIIDAALAAADVNWLAIAVEARHKKFGGAAPGDFSERSKQMRFLQYRGFTNDQIQQAMNAPVTFD